MKHLMTWIVCLAVVTRAWLVGQWGEAKDGFQGRNEA